MLDNKNILSQNLTRLLETREGSRLDLSRQMKVADGSLGRIKYETGNPTLEALENIARFFKLEVWHLFIPGLDPKNPPPLPGTEVANWPFQRVTVESITSLEATDRSFIEGRLSEAIYALQSEGIDKNKSEAG